MGEALICFGYTQNSRFPHLPQFRLLLPSSAPSISVPPPIGMASSSDVDLSRLPVVVTANQLITRSLFRANNEQMATVIQQQTARISALEKQVALLAKGKAPMSDPPSQPSQSAADSLTIPELKGLLFSKLLESDGDLVSILQQQTALQQRAIQEQRSQAHLVTHTEFQQFQATLDAPLPRHSPRSTRCSLMAYHSYLIGFEALKRHVKLLLDGPLDGMMIMMIMIVMRGEEKKET
ncbi:hypothetical protein OSB04_un000895 [Centaurea solstitialis]|uniref:Uncharacterized protein n=1 Tax=Centaurea solstitialis TaxID=347529 RepID=A0AA38W5G2_9ASTR|nr:hypothetical protein OSB04_un000895 [Centaurea solstitialis]